jgi:hypothetical protein
MIDRLFYATVIVALSALFALSTAETVRLAKAPPSQVVQLERVVITSSKAPNTVASATDETAAVIR